MPLKQPLDRKKRPFPWLCSDCFRPAVFPVIIPYTAKVKHDGVIHELHLLALEVARCQKCGQVVITSAADEQINDALRSHFQLLTPAQIRSGTEKLGLRHRELAERLGVASETISRWVEGALIQPQAMDGRLRLLFGPPA